MMRPLDPNKLDAADARVKIASLAAPARFRRPGYLRACQQAAYRTTRTHLYLRRSEYERLSRRYRPWRSLLPKPGDCLAWWIRTLVGRSAQGCGRCNGRRQQMNAWGWRGCLKRLPTIYGWLRTEARTLA